MECGVKHLKSSVFRIQNGKHILEMDTSHCWAVVTKVVFAISFEPNFPIRKSKKQSHYLSQSLSKLIEKRKTNISCWKCELMPRLMHTIALTSIDPSSRSLLVAVAWNMVNFSHLSLNKALNWTHCIQMVRTENRRKNAFYSYLWMGDHAQGAQSVE